MSKKQQLIIIFSSLAVLAIVILGIILVDYNTGIIGFNYGVSSYCESTGSNSIKKCSGSVVILNGDITLNVGGNSLMNDGTYSGIVEITVEEGYFEVEQTNGTVRYESGETASINFDSKIGRNRRIGLEVSGEAKNLTYTAELDFTSN